MLMGGQEFMTVWYGNTEKLQYEQLIQLLMLQIAI
jgi:hypothetical protein